MCRGHSNFEGLSLYSPLPPPSAALVSLLAIALRLRSVNVALAAASSALLQSLKLARTCSCSLHYFLRSREVRPLAGSQEGQPDFSPRSTCLRCWAWSCSHTQCTPSHTTSWKGKRWLWREIKLTVRRKPRGDSSFPWICLPSLCGIIFFFAETTH